jgi:hypothetical protein
MTNLQRDTRVFEAFYNRHYKSMSKKEITSAGHLAISRLLQLKKRRDDIPAEETLVQMSSERLVKLNESMMADERQKIMKSNWIAGLVAMWCLIELSLCYMGVKAEGYAKSQIDVLPMYMPSLDEIVFESSFAEGGRGSPYMTCIIITCVSTVGFVLSKYLLGNNASFVYKQACNGYINMFDKSAKVTGTASNIEMGAEAVYMNSKK